MIELIAGVALLVLVLVDLLDTTLGGHGAGPITRVISAGGGSLPQTAPARSATAWSTAVPAPPR